MDGLLDEWVEIQKQRGINIAIVVCVCLSVCVRPVEYYVGVYNQSSIEPNSVTECFVL
jgi:hypothetical protein